MFCKWVDNAVVETYHGNRPFVADNGTKFSKSFWGPQTSDAERAAHDVYRYVELKWPEDHTGSDPSWALVDFTVTKSYDTIALKDVEILKARKINKLANLRKGAETGGVYVTRNSKVYVLDTTIASQNRVSSAVIHLNEGTATNRKWSFYEETGGPTDPAAVWTAKRVQLSKAIFKSIGVEMGDHVDACFDAQDAHVAAITALNTAQEVFDYDETANWPTNPIHPDSREPI